MPAKQNFEGLINAAWNVVDSDFNATAFLEWRKVAIDYLTEMLGPDHYYTQHFGNEVLQGEAVSVLSGTGILSAAREQIINGDCQILSRIAM